MRLRPIGLVFPLTADLGGHHRRDDFVRLDDVEAGGVEPVISCTSDAAPPATRPKPRKRGHPPFTSTNCHARPEPDRTRVSSRGAGEYLVGVSAYSDYPPEVCRTSGRW